MNLSKGCVIDAENQVIIPKDFNEHSKHIGMSIFSL